MRRLVVVPAPALALPCGFACPRPLHAQASAPVAVAWVVNEAWTARDLHAEHVVQTSHAQFVGPVLADFLSRNDAPRDPAARKEQAHG